MFLLLKLMLTAVYIGITLKLSEVISVKFAFSSILFLVVMSLGVYACTNTTTKTITITNTNQLATSESVPFTTIVTVQNTITSNIQGATTPTTVPQVILPVFDKEPPEIPHSIYFVMPGITYMPGDKPLCFECHPIPILHEDWLLNTELCTQCHMVSDMPYLEE
jgi:hypothetical protein